MFQAAGKKYAIIQNLTHRVEGDLRMSARKSIHHTQITQLVHDARHAAGMAENLTTRAFFKDIFRPASSGQTMLDVAARADEMFTDLQGRSRSYSGQLSGKLVVTALPGLAPLILPTLLRFHRANPEIQLELAASTSLARLEYGEAHIAFRAGAKPDTPDYVVRQFKLIRFGLYASNAYIEERGHPNPDKLKGHFLVGPASDRSRLPYVQWIKTLSVQK